MLTLSGQKMAGAIPNCGRMAIPGIMWSFGADGRGAMQIPPVSTTPTSD